MPKPRVHITDLVLRDAHQSLLATRMRTEDMLPVAERLNQIGYWSLEMWGGATFDSCLRFLNEDPWERVRLLKAAMPDTRMQMLLRGQNIVGYRNYADDVVREFVRLSAKAGIDVFRIFDALNDSRNMETAIEAVREQGMMVEATISYTISPVHDIPAYVLLAERLVELGSESICIKDMAGLLSPSDAYDLVKALKTEFPDVLVHLHCHYTSGMASMSYLRSVEAGCDILDTDISSMSMGSAHPPTESIVAALAGTEYDTGLDIGLLKDISDYFRQVRKKYAEYESAFTGVDPAVLQWQIPGGMISNLSSQLRESGALERMDEVLEEVPRVREELGYPPLVTPSSQIVGTQATLNVLMGERYKMITNETKNYVRGLYGRPPAPIDHDVQVKCIGEEEPVTVRPADLLDPELPARRKELAGKGMDFTEEDLVSFTLFPRVALNFFSRRDRDERPDEEVAAIAAALADILFAEAATAPAQAQQQPTVGPDTSSWAMAGRVDHHHRRSIHWRY
jgi:oxaloacetate decarboxylase alpha subunit